MALMNESGFLFLLRWIHFLSGITWIGILYYFNFVQTPFFAETEAPVRSGAQQKLLPRAMWWFCWGAMITFLSGWTYLGYWWIPKRTFSDPQTWIIFLGGLIGSVMWFNVWFVIHPKQKIVIQNAVDTAAGRPDNPAAAPAGARGGLASRTNTLLSMPGSGAAFWLIALVILLLIELNALMVAPGKPTTKPLATVKGTLWAGFILTLIYYLLFEVMKRSS